MRRDRNTEGVMGKRRDGRGASTLAEAYKEHIRWKLCIKHKLLMGLFAVSVWTYLDLVHSVPVGTLGSNLTSERTIHGNVFSLFSSDAGSSGLLECSAPCILWSSLFRLPLSGVPDIAAFEDRWFVDAVCSCHAESSLCYSICQFS